MLIRWKLSKIFNDARSLVTGVGQIFRVRAPKILTTTLTNRSSSLPTIQTIQSIQFENLTMIFSTSPYIIHMNKKPKPKVDFAVEIDFVDRHTYEGPVRGIRSRGFASTTEIFVYINNTNARVCVSSSILVSWFWTRLVDVYDTNEMWSPTR